MASSIRVNSGAITERAAEWHNRALQVASFMKTLDSWVDELRVEWNGEASRYFYERYMTEGRPQVFEIGDSFEQVSAMYQNVAEILDGVDASVAKPKSPSTEPLFSAATVAKSAAPASAPAGRSSAPAAKRERV